MTIYKINRYIGEIFFVIFLLILSYSISVNYYQLMLIQGSSMEPQYHNMQFVLVKKNYNVNDLQQGDTIAFRCDKLNAILVKRIVALPGQTAKIENGTLWVDNVPSAFYENKTFEYAGMLSDPVVLKDGEFIVLGDNLSESVDSRYDQVGIVKLDKITGVIL